jgi:hypothetical protein
MPGPPTGSVQFFDGSNLLGTAALNGSGVAQFSTSLAVTGSHAIQAVYGGDAVYGQGSSTAMTETVTATPTHPSVTLSTQSYLVLSGKPVTFSAYVGGGVGITGNVTLYDGATPLGTVALVAGQASFTVPPMSVGSHNMTVGYSGNADFAAATSSVQNEVVVAPVANTISGQGATLAGQDTFAVNAQTSIAAGVPSFSGSLSFSDSKAGVTFNAATITSVAVWQVTGTPSSNATDTYFTITGTATLGSGTAANYNFVAIVSLPISGVANSTGGLIFQVTGPNGYSYSVPWEAWAAGESLAVKILS